MTFNTQELCGKLDETRGYNMQTCSGKPLWPADPRPEDIRSEDFVALARICRFNGHMRRDVQHYSVMQHLIFVYRKVAEKHPLNYRLHLAALLHDAHEYIYGDMIKPQKVMYPERKAIEHAGDVAIAWKFNFAVELFDHPSIKEADYRTFLTEQRDLLEPGDTDFGEASADPYPEKIVPEPFEDVIAEFSQILTELVIRIGARP